jgi:hypothetical protein
MSYATELMKSRPTLSIMDAVKEVKAAWKEAEKVECPEGTK